MRPGRAATEGWALGRIPRRKAVPAVGPARQPLFDMPIGPTRSRRACSGTQRALRSEQLFAQASPLSPIELRNQYGVNAEYWYEFRSDALRGVREVVVDFQHAINREEA